MRNPFRRFNSSPEVIRLTVMMYVRYPVGIPVPVHSIKQVRYPPSILAQAWVRVWDYTEAYSISH